MEVHFGWKDMSATSLVAGHSASICGQEYKRPFTDTDLVQSRDQLLLFVSVNFGQDPEASPV
jgi:hypothetical protein